MDHLADAPIANILILAGIIFLAVGLFGRIGGYIGRIFGNIEAGNNSRVLAGVLGAVLIFGGVWMHQQGDKSAASHVAPTTGSAANAPTTAATSSPATTPATAPTTAAPVGAGAPSTAPPPADPAKDKSNPVLAATNSQTPATPAADRERLVSPSSLGDSRLVATWTNVIPPRGNTVAKIEISRSAQGLEAHIWSECNTKICDEGMHPLTVSGNTSTYDFTKGNRRFVGTVRVFAPDVLLLSADSYEPGTLNHWHHNRVLTSPNLPGKMQTAFSQYLDSPGAKAFAMTPGGRAAWHLKSNTVEEAAQKALRNCEDHGWHDCRIILLNDEGPQ